MPGPKPGALPLGDTPMSSCRWAYKDDALVTPKDQETVYLEREKGFGLSSLAVLLTPAEPPFVAKFSSVKICPPLCRAATSDSHPFLTHSHFSTIWSGKRGSNPRHPAWKASALPTELFPHHLLKIFYQNSSVWQIDFL